SVTVRPEPFRCISTRISPASALAPATKICGSGPETEPVAATRGPPTPRTSKCRRRGGRSQPTEAAGGAYSGDKESQMNAQSANSATSLGAGAPALQAATCGAAENEAGGILTIDLDALRANYRKLAARVVPGECAAVVKADAYGCGIEPVTAALLRAGCKT